MPAPLQPLLDLAFQRSPAAQANQAITEVREAHPGKKPASYEVVARPEQTLAELAAELLPRLVYHLESIGAHPPGCGDIFLSLFAGEELFFIHGRDAFPVLARAAGLTTEQLVERYGTGELRRPLRPGETPPKPGPKEVLMLPPSTGKAPR